MVAGGWTTRTVIPATTSDAGTWNPEHGLHPRRHLHAAGDHQEANAHAGADEIRFSFMAQPLKLVPQIMGVTIDSASNHS